MVMTLNVLHGMDGYEYLTRTVTSGDGARVAWQKLADFYEETGTPPGRWFGGGTAELGVDGVIDSAQMRSLFGAGLHPNANAITAAARRAGLSVSDAQAAAQLGSPLYALKGTPTPIARIHHRLLAEHAVPGRAPSRRRWVALRRQAAIEHLRSASGREPSPAQVHDALGDERRKMRTVAIGAEAAFTPPKTFQVLWALLPESSPGDDPGAASDRSRQALVDCHREAVEETLAYAERHFAIARRGRGGARKIDTTGFTVALFEHWENRAGDPGLHTHAVISAKCFGVDRKWSSLDLRPLLAAGTSLSCRYNAAFAAKVRRRFGVEIEERSRGRNKAPVLEIAGIPEELAEYFSRRGDIEARIEQLADDFRDRHGRSPSKREQYRLAEQATIDTRAPKPAARPLSALHAEWHERAAGWLASVGDPRTVDQFIADVLAGHPGPATAFDARHVAVNAGVALGGVDAVHAACADDPAQVDRAIDTALRRCQFTTPAGQVAAAQQVRNLLAPNGSLVVAADIEARIEALRRRVFDPDVIAAEVASQVAARRSTWTECHVRGAVEDRLAVCTFDSEPAHRAAVEQMVDTVLHRHSLRLTVDPDLAPEALRRRNGDSVFEAPSATTVRYTSRAILDSEARLSDAAVAPSAELLPQRAVTAAVAAVEQQQERALNSGQRRFVQHLCGSGTRLAVAVGPAGAGKTTALQAVVRAWRDSGRAVVPLCPSKSAAKVLGAEIRVPATTIAALLWAHRIGTAAPLPAGAMILVDEAGMASTADLDELQQLADRAGAVVRWVGDPWQLSAVEAGGALKLIATDTNAPELDAVVRFGDPDEAVASLHVRNGDPRAAWEFYDTRGRVRSGLAGELRAQILAAHLADADQGVSSLMMAASSSDVTKLNAAAQRAHTARGVVATTGIHTVLADEHRGFLGDIVVTRRNSSRLRVVSGPHMGSPVANGDRWRVIAVHPDRSLTVANLEHRGRVRLPADYVAEHVELGYAVTVHRAQGLTVDRAHLLMGESLGRALAYVGLSRGRDRNTLYIATDALPEPLPWEHPPEEPDTAREVFLKVLARTDDNVTATEVMRAELAALDDPQRLHDMYSATVQFLGRARGQWLLERALPVVTFDTVRRAPGWEALLDTLTVAEQLGVDVTAALFDALTDHDRDDGSSVVTARDAAALLGARLDRIVHTRLQPVGAVVGAGPTGATSETTRFRALRDAALPPVVPLPPRHPGVDTAVADFAADLRARLLAVTGGSPSQPDDRGGVPVAEPDEEPSPAGLPAAAQQLRLRRDYEHYADYLARERARYLIGSALPVVLARLVASAPSYARLLDTLVVADRHRFNAAALLAAITATGAEPLLAAADPAAWMCARADAWIAARTPVITTATAAAELPDLTYDHGRDTALTRAAVAASLGSDVLAVGPHTSRFRAVKQLPPLRGLAPIPAEHPGMDVRVADHADELRRQLLGLPDDSPDWRARAAAAAAAAAADDDGGTDDVAGPEGWAASRWADAETGAAEPDWDTSHARTTPDPHGELAPVDRAIRIRTELAAARADLAVLRSQVLTRTHAHQLEVEPRISAARQRMDALRPAVLAVLDARARWRDAEFDAARAARAAHHARTAATEPADDEFLQRLAAQIPAADIDTYREVVHDATTERAALEIADLTHLAEQARAVADRMLAQVRAAQRALDQAARYQPVPDEYLIRQWRDDADDRAQHVLDAARAHVGQLDAQAARADHHAITVLATDLGIGTSSARWELERRYGQAVTAAANTTPNPPPIPHTSSDDATSDDWVTAAMTSAERSYPDLDPRERVRWLQALVDATEAGLLTLRLGAAEGRGMLARRDVPANDDVPSTDVLLRARDASQQELHAATQTAQAAEVSYREALRQQLDPGDSDPVTSLRRAIAASTDDTQRARLTQLLAQYQAAATPSVDLDRLRHNAAETRAWATQLAHEYEALDTELPHDDLDTISTQERENSPAACDLDEIAIRRTSEDLQRLYAQFQRAHSMALADDHSSAGTEADATADLPRHHSQHRTLPADEHAEVAAAMRDDPLRMLSDIDLDTRIQSLHRAARAVDPTLVELPAQTEPQLDITRARHTLLAQQVQALHRAQDALDTAEIADTDLENAATAVTAARRHLDSLAAHKARSRHSAREQLARELVDHAAAAERAITARAAATAAVAAAAAVGAPQHRWAALLEQADPDTLVAEVAAAERADTHARELRERAAQRAARAAAELEAAQQEKRRRRDLPPEAAAVEQALRATGPGDEHDSPPPTKRAAPPAVPPEMQLRQVDRGPGLQT
ncbi:MobF family relaxase [Nocardia niigatensis]